MNTLPRDGELHQTSRRREIGDIYFKQKYLAKAAIPAGWDSIRAWPADLLSLDRSWGCEWQNAAQLKGHLNLISQPKMSGGLQIVHIAHCRSLLLLIISDWKGYLVLQIMFARLNFTWGNVEATWWALPLQETQCLSYHWLSSVCLATFHPNSAFWS